VKQLIQSLLLGTLCLFSNINHACPAGAVPDLYQVKKVLIQYHDDGRYEKEIAAVDKEAQHYIAARISQRKPQEKLAIVLDIDDTSLSNYPDMVAMGFGGTLKQINEAMNKGTDPVIQPTLALYQFAKKNHIAVFFITGRYESQREITEKNLTQVGFQHWDGLIFKAEDYHKASVIPYKSSARKALEADGYTIIASIGDQLSDLAGGYAEKGFKLPNPYYFLP